MRHLACLAAAWLLCLPAASAAGADSSLPIAGDWLRELSWLEGSWVHDDAGASMEEHWSRSGAGFMGMFREAKEQRSTFMEIMAIEADGADVILGIRHFGPGLKTAWEEKDKPMRFKLGDVSACSASFTGLDAQAGERLVYRLIDKSTLEITGEFLRGGRKVIETFALQRKRCRCPRSGDERRGP